LIEKGQLHGRPKGLNPNQKGFNVREFLVIASDRRQGIRMLRGTPIVANSHLDLAEGIVPILFYQR
jgi:hypothetical protein